MCQLSYIDKGGLLSKEESSKAPRIKTTQKNPQKSDRFFKKCAALRGIVPGALHCPRQPLATNKAVICTRARENARTHA